MSKPKFKENDVLFHDEQKKILIVDSKYYVNGKGWLYTLRAIQKSPEGMEYKRYYENKIKDQCTKSKNAKAAKILFGKSK